MRRVSRDSRTDACSVDALYLRGVGEDCGEFAGEPLDLLIVQLESRECGDTANLGGRE